MIVQVLNVPLMRSSEQFHELENYKNAYLPLETHSTTKRVPTPPMTLITSYTYTAERRVPSPSHRVTVVSKWHIARPSDSAHKAEFQVRNDITNFATMTRTVQV